MRPKTAEREEARRLRSELGMPIKQIAARLAVSSSSVHVWTSDIEIAAQQDARNRVRAAAARATAWSEANRELRRGYQLEGRRRAREADPLHQAGCMLYWAEGSKGRNTVGLSNSDVQLVRFFRRFLTTSLGVHPARIKVSLNVYLNNGLSIEQIERRWLDALQLPPGCLRKHIVDHHPTSSSGRSRRRLPYGVCHLRVDSTRTVQHIYGAIQEYAGFEEPRWLDGPG